MQIQLFSLTMCPSHEVAYLIMFLSESPQPVSSAGEGAMATALSIKHGKW